MMLTKTVAIEAIRPGGDINSRTSNPTANVSDLVASIKAHGLLQPLICDLATENGHEVYRVIDGNRRFAALKKIHGKKTADVPVVVLDVASAREASLAANVVRVDLHPVDEYRAFAALAAEGASVDDIAKRFNKKAQWVKQRLGLAALAPELLDTWLKGDLSGEQAEALTLAPNQEAQLAVWQQAKSSSEWNLHPDRLRDSIRRLTLCEKNDARLLYVGPDAYKAVGGTFKGDLFSSDEFPDRPDLLDNLVAEKASVQVDRLIAAGWKWVDVNPRDHYRYRDADWREFATDADLAAYAEAKDWGAQRKVVEAIFERASSDPAVMAQYGATLRLSSSGEMGVHFLRMRPAEWEAKQQQQHDDEDDEDASASSSAPAPEPAKPRISAALTESLSEVMTVAISKAVAANPNVALSMLLATLSVKLTSYHASPVMLVGQPWRGIALERKKDATTSSLDWATEFVGAQSMDIEDQIKALSGLVASLIDLRQTRNGTPAGDSRDPAIKAISASLFSDVVRSEIAAAFDPAAYFDKVSTPLIDEACTEMGEPAPKGKKKEKVEAAAEFARAAGWLPPELRTVHYSGPGRAQPMKEAAE